MLIKLFNTQSQLFPRRNQIPGKAAASGARQGRGVGERGNQRALANPDDERGPGEGREETRVFWGVRACVRVGSARTGAHALSRPPGFLQTVRTTLSLGKVFWIADPGGKEEAAGARELPGAAWERSRDTPNAVLWVSRGGEGARGSGAPGSLGWTTECEGQESFPRTSALTILVEAQERGAGGGAPKTSVSESSRKPDARNLRSKQTATLGVKIGDETGVPEHPDFRSVKGRRCPWAFRLG